MKFPKQLLTIFGFVLFAAIGFACIVFVYFSGLEMGKYVGRCELACEKSGGVFLSVDDDNISCQCQSTGFIPWIYWVDSSTNKGANESG